MHVSSKDSSQDGRLHTLTSTLEADGAFELVSADEKLEAKIVSITRTASGGIEIVAAIAILPKEEAAVSVLETDAVIN